MKSLTERQCSVLKYIEGYISKFDYSPALREIATEFEISSTAAGDIINALKKKGYLGHSETAGARAKARSLHVLRHGDGSSAAGAVKIPLVGDIAAGEPVMSEENFERTISVDSALLRGGEATTGVFFAMRVTGDSMRDRGIDKGDIVIIQKRSWANDADIVAVSIEGRGVTLKRFFREPNRVRLESENELKHYPPIYAQNAHIEGKLVCAIKRDF
jgi:repressor LexA